MTQAESWLLHLIPAEGQLALDVGANEGSFTRLLAERFEWVHAFDPNPQILPVLRELVSRPECENVRLYEYAIHREPSLVTLHLYPGPEHASVYPRQRGPAESKIQVVASSLDALHYSDGGPAVDFIKIDVEGGEADVLVGAERTLRQHRPQLLIEIHNLDNLWFSQRWLAKRGYQVEHIPHPHLGVPPGHCWLHALVE